MRWKHANTSKKTVSRLRNAEVENWNVSELSTEGGKKDRKERKGVS